MIASSLSRLAEEKMNTTVSDFVLTKVCAEAQEVLSVQSQFRFNNDEWNEICKSLDSPPRIFPRCEDSFQSGGI